MKDQSPTTPDSALSTQDSGLGTKRIEAIRSLYNPNFRLYWIGLVISNIGSWVQVTGQGWLVYQLTKKSLYLGVVGFASSLPMLILLLIGGAFADRFDRRKLIFATQSVFTVNALVLGILVATGWIHIWHVLALAFISGTVMAFDMPARQAFVQELVGNEDLMNAVALNSAMFNSARIVGPAVAGILIAKYSLAVCYFVNSASFLAVLIALFFVKLPSWKSGSSGSSVWEDLVEGLHYLKQNDTIRALIVMAAIPSIFAMPYATMMPAFAREVLHANPSRYGFLYSSVGIGALTGAMGLASLSGFPHRGKLILGAALALSAALFCFTMSSSYWMAIALLPFIGMSASIYMASSNTTLQVITPPELRGRVLSAFMVAFAGMGPIGNLQAGLVSNVVGVAMALRIGAVVCGLSALAVAVLRPDIRRLRV